MAEFSNPKLPQEEVNVGADRPLRNFFGLVFGALAVGALCAGTLALAAGEFADLLPYRAELRLVEPYAAKYDRPPGEVEAYLQGLAGRLAARASLPEGSTTRNTSRGSAPATAATR